MPQLPPVPNTPLRDDPTQDSIWKRWLQLLKQSYSALGTVTSVSGTGTVNGITLTGTVTTSGSLTLGGTLSGVNLATQVTGILPGANGGTGVANTGKTITLGGNLTTTPANAITFTTTGATNVTLPTSGTLSTTTGTVTTVSVVTANGVSGSVANPTTTPAITLTLGAITPSSVSTGALTSSALTSGRVTFAGASGLLTDDADLTFNGTLLTTHSATVATGPLIVATQGTNQLRVGTSTASAGATVAAVLYLNSASGAGFQLTAGSGGGLAIIGAQGGGCAFYTHTGAVGSETYVQGFAVNHAASATNFLTTTPSNGGAPTLTTNGGNLGISPSANVVIGGIADLISSADKLSVVGRASIQSPASATTAIVCWNVGTTGDNSFMNFGTEGSFTSRGSITYNRGGGVVAYNTTSDERAKTVKGRFSDSGAMIDAVPVYLGRMNGAALDMPTIKAHELQAVAPYAVTGERGGIEMQQVSYPALIPLMWAEIQSLRARVSALEARK